MCNIRTYLERYVFFFFVHSLKSIASSWPKGKTKNLELKTETEAKNFIKRHNSQPNLSFLTFCIYSLFSFNFNFIMRGTTEHLSKAYNHCCCLLIPLKQPPVIHEFAMAYTQYHQCENYRHAVLANNGNWSRQCKLWIFF